MEGIAAAAAQSSGEVRRLHIIYFISRKGRIEHPHLIRVHHSSRNGVRLRDIKRWLSELRGKDMPESYAWSYKRRYKTGFVWQDLLDEDLINPIADNEYVLKGSEIPSAAFDHSFSDEKEGAKNAEKLPSCAETKSSHQISSPKVTLEEKQESAMNMLTKPLLEIDEQSSTTFSSDSTSSLTDDSLKFEHKDHSSSRREIEENDIISKNEETEEDDEISGENEQFILSNESKKKIHLNNFIKVKKSDPIPDQSSESSSSKSKFSKSRSYSNNASSMFRNLLTCGTVDTNDSGMMVIRRRSASKNKPTKLDVAASKGDKKMAEICRGDIVGGSERISRISWRETHDNEHRRSCDGASESKQKKKNDMNIPKPVPAAYKPRSYPNCSQCGRTFKPEHLHRHMKSCRGMKALSKGGATAIANTSFQRRSANSPVHHSTSSHYLTNK